MRAAMRRAHRVRSCSFSFPSSSKDGEGDACGYAQGPPSPKLQFLFSILLQRWRRRCVRLCAGPTESEVAVSLFHPPPKMAKAMRAAMRRAMKAKKAVAAAPKAMRRAMKAKKAVAAAPKAMRG